jgi:hypothetical protein
MTRQRLSHRLKGLVPDGPFEGIPDHLRYPVHHWFATAIGDEGDGPWRSGAMRELAIRFRTNVPPDYDIPRLVRVLLVILDGQDQEMALDMVDAALDVLGPNLNGWETLQKHLDAGASAWKVADDRISLTGVVSDEAQATYEQAASVADEATKELKVAWANAFGRNGDPSDAWDHAIKAVEDVLIPEMMPNNGNATIGHVVGELAGQNGAAWKLALPGNNQDHDVAHLVSMLRLIWPNHDRHGGTGPKRTPSRQEARAVVTLAATIVQWHREGSVLQRR